MGWRESRTRSPCRLGSKRLLRPSTPLRERRNICRPRRRRFARRLRHHHDRRRSGRTPEATRSHSSHFIPDTRSVASLLTSEDCMKTIAYNLGLALATCSGCVLWTETRPSENYCTNVEQASRPPSTVSSQIQCALESIFRSHPVITKSEFLGSSRSPSVTESGGVATC